MKQGVVRDNRTAAQLNFVEQETDKSAGKIDSKLVYFNIIDIVIYIINFFLMKGMLESFAPSTEFEKELAGMLQQSGQDTTTIAKYDELPVNKLTPEQVDFHKIWSAIR